MFPLTEYYLKMTTLFITLRCLLPLLAFANIPSPVGALHLHEEARAHNPAVGLTQPSPVLHPHLPSFISLLLTFPSVPFHSEEHQRTCRCSSCCFISTCCSLPCHPLSVSGRPPSTFKTQHVPPPTHCHPEWDQGLPWTPIAQNELLCPQPSYRME